MRVGAGFFDVLFYFHSVVSQKYFALFGRGSKAFLRATLSILGDRRMLNGA
jgi:hypothetical protein